MIKRGREDRGAFWECGMRKGDVFGILEENEGWRVEVCWRGKGVSLERSVVKRILNDLINKIFCDKYSMARGPKKHLKRINTPRSWLLSKMGGINATRPNQGPHKLRECLPLSVVIRYSLFNPETTSSWPTTLGKPTSLSKTSKPASKLIINSEKIWNSPLESWTSSMLPKPTRATECSMMSREDSTLSRSRVLNPTSNSLKSRARPLDPTKSPTSWPTTEELSDTPTQNWTKVILWNSTWRRTQSANGSRTNPDTLPTSQVETTLVEWPPSFTWKDTWVVSTSCTWEMPTERPSPQEGAMCLSLETRSHQSPFLKVTVNISTFWRRRLFVKTKRESPLNDEHCILNYSLHCSLSPELYSIIKFH